MGPLEAFLREAKPVESAPTPKLNVRRRQSPLSPLPRYGGG